VEVGSDGTVYVAWLDIGDLHPEDALHTFVQRSTDHGTTWNDPVDVAGTQVTDWSDHGGLTISDDGHDVYVAFSAGDSFVAASHDGGTTFGAPVQTNPSGEQRWYFHFNGAVLPDGSVAIAAAAFRGEPGFAQALVRYVTLRSVDGGVTWQQIPVGNARRQPDCYTEGCVPNHWGAHSSLAADASGDLVYAYAGTRNAGRGQLIFASRSSDSGLTWSDAKRLTPLRAEPSQRRVIASFPTVVSAGGDDFRLVWMDDRNGERRWNTFSSRSADSGVTWKETARISDAHSGAPYKHPRGFESDYGDYLDVAVTSEGKTLSAWGEGYSFAGPGGTWINAES